MLKNNQFNAVETLTNMDTLHLHSQEEEEGLVVINAL